MATRKKANDNHEFVGDQVVYSIELAQAVLYLTQAWDSFRIFYEDPSRELTEREINHFKSALFIIKEMHEQISVVAQDYNYTNAKLKNKVIPFNTGGLPDGKW